MAEGDTVHRAARRLNAALGGHELRLADAPNPRSPLHLRAGELAGRTLIEAEALGKHLLVRLSGGLVLHSHLGLNGSWQVSAGGRWPAGLPWLRLGSRAAAAAQRGGRLLRLVSESRARNDPTLTQLGPDPLRAGFDLGAAARRLLGGGGGLEVGEALLDQRLVAGIGNAIRNEACFAARISPWRRVEGLSPAEAERLLAEAQRIMRASVVSGRRPHAVYRAHRRGCPRCGGQVHSRGQGEANRVAYWCPACQG